MIETRLELEKGASMTTMKVEQIKVAVLNLSWPELDVFRKWYGEFEAIRWDRQIEADIQAGKLDKLAQETLADFDAGLCTAYRRGIQESRLQPVLEIAAFSSAKASTPAPRGFSPIVC
jgi:hypothetical protein